MPWIYYFFVLYRFLLYFYCLFRLLEFGWITSFRGRIIFYPQKSSPRMGSRPRRSIHNIEYMYITRAPCLTCLIQLISRAKLSADGRSRELFSAIASVFFVDLMEGKGGYLSNVVDTVQKPPDSMEWLFFFFLSLA